MSSKRNIQTSLCFSTTKKKVCFVRKEEPSPVSRTNLPVISSSVSQKASRVLEELLPVSYINSLPVSAVTILLQSRDSLYNGLW